MKLNPHVFREYDIRGYVESDFSPEFAELLGRAYASLAKDSTDKQIAIGWDCRESSEGFANALAKGISSEGLDVLLTGMGPTPQLYFSVFSRDLGGGIQVTGSHNPSDMNGFKICLGKKTLSGAAIQDLRNRMESLLETEAKPGNPGKIEAYDIRQDYIDYLVENCQSHFGDRKLKVVVDAGNGVGGLVGPEVLRRLGLEVHELYCDPDGSFPNHHPDPTVMKNLEDLIAKVKETGADLGIGWDGDGDRIGVVDQNGDVVFGDMLLLIYGRSILQEVPGATIIGDVKCSSRLFQELNNAGGNAVMWKTGHSLIKSKLIETEGELAGEMSGHIFFKHRYFGYDDALYSSARLAEILSKTDTPFSELLSDVPAMVATPEIRVDCPDDQKFEVISKAQQLFSDFEVDTIDGVRIQFDKGWGLVRASNTQPVLVMRFEADSAERLQEYQQLVEERIEGVR